MAEIENVSDTARWVAVYRAMETERADAIFRDPYAARLAGEKGHAIVASMKRGRQTAWPMIVRTAVFDEIILDRVHNGGVDQIVNLAAGLDARPWRMKGLPATLKWVDVDLPAILDHKLGIMRDETPLCAYDAVRVDLRDEAKRRALFAQLGAAARRTLVVTEGLLIYLTAEQVGALASDLHTPRSFQWWVIDIASPGLRKMMQRMWGKSVNAGNAPFQFAPEESTQFFDKFGWKELEFHSMIADAQRLKRGAGPMFLWRLFARLRTKRGREKMRRFSGTALLERR